MSHAEACDDVDDEHNYPYECDDEDETLLCCTLSSLTDPIFEDTWGTCHKIEENEEEEEAEEDVVSCVLCMLSSMYFRFDL